MIKQITKLLRNHNLQSWICGGTARDLFMGRDIINYDVAVNATLTRLSKVLKPKVIRVNEYDVSITINYLNQDFVLYPLKEIKLVNTYFNYEYVNELFRDSNTRDFTVNALYYDPLSGTWFDFHNGRKDIKNKIIRFVGDPTTRILESKIRLLRGAIFCGLFGNGWRLDHEAHRSINEHRLKILPVHPKQVYPEVVKLMTRVEKPSIVFKILRNTKLIDPFFPELRDCINVKQSNKKEGLDLFQHIMYALDGVSLQAKNLLLLRMAALLHDIGKPYTEVYTESGLHFYNHENAGAYIAERILQRWGFNRQQIEKEVLYIKSHLFDASYKVSDQSIRKLIAKVGPDNIHTLLDLRMADRVGTGRRDISMKKIFTLRDRVNKQLSRVSPKDFKLQLSDEVIIKILKKKTDNIKSTLAEAKHFLTNKVIYGRTMNKSSSLRKALNKVNLITCPLDKPHLFKTWSDLLRDNADVFPDGNLKCGMFCSFLCNEIIKSRK